MINNKSLFITGATGFVGRALLEKISDCADKDITVATRIKAPTFLQYPNYFITNLNSDTDWRGGLQNKDVVIHAAARVHVMNDSASDQLEEYRSVNVEGTLRLARQAAMSGVRRFIFISSIKVNGECTRNGVCFTADDSPSPSDFYGQSKAEAEKELRELAAESGMEVVIIRPPLVYGRGVKGNFETMLKIVDKGIPLPLGSVRNKRSMVAIENLVDLVTVCIDHPLAANEIFLAGDGLDLSTPDFIREIGNAKGKAVRLFSVPQSVLMLGASIIGKRAIAQRVLGSLQVDISKAKELLGWTPPLSVSEGIRRCV